jgi:tetratricopeptide (TPR) repeat protein
VQIIKISLRILGREHPSTLSIMFNLASTYRNQGQWKEAEELEVQVIEISLRVLGREHPDTLGSITNLALTYQNQGRWKKAEELKAQVIKISLRVLGREHPDTLTTICRKTIDFCGPCVPSAQLTHKLLVIKGLSAHHENNHPLDYRGLL